MVAPAPTGPQCSMRRHNWLRSGIARAASAGSAPMRPLSLPWRAGPVVPPTGHSTKAAPFARTRSASSIPTWGGTVLISTNSLSLMSPARSPVGPPYTASMAAASVRIVMTVSAAPASAAALAATAAPAAASGLHFSAERFHTVTALPVSMSRPAIALPILPRPATPTFIRLPPTRTRRKIGDRRAGRKSDLATLRPVQSIPERRSMRRSHTAVDVGCGGRAHRVDGGKPAQGGARSSGVAPDRIGQGRGEQGRFGSRQAGGRFAERPTSAGLGAKFSAWAPFRNIEIDFKLPAFWNHEIDPQRQWEFQGFAEITVPGPQEQVFGELLRDAGRAARTAHAVGLGLYHAAQFVEINSMMAAETRVLGGNHGA